MGRKACFHRHIRSLTRSLNLTRCSPVARDLAECLIETWKYLLYKIIENIIPAFLTVIKRVRNCEHAIFFEAVCPSSDYAQFIDSSTTTMTKGIYTLAQRTYCFGTGIKRYSLFKNLFSLFDTSNKVLYTSIKVLSSLSNFVGTTFPCIL